MDRGGLLRGPYTFRPHERLHTSGDYQRVKREGKRVVARHFVVNLAPNDFSHHRLGMVVQKRYYSSVQRNRIKRLLREWFRHQKDTIPLPGRDFVIVARAGAHRLSYAEIARELSAVLAGQDGRSK